MRCTAPRFPFALRVGSLTQQRPDHLRVPSCAPGTRGKHRHRPSIVKGLCPLPLIRPPRALPDPALQLATTTKMTSNQLLFLYAPLLARVLLTIWHIVSGGPWEKGGKRDSEEEVGGVTIWGGTYGYVNHSWPGGIPRSALPVARNSAQLNLSKVSKSAAPTFAKVVNDANLRCSLWLWLRLWCTFQ